MKLIPSFSWFAHWRARRSVAPTPTDFGDMGTAFGMEASLDATLDATPDPELPTQPAVFVKKGHSDHGAPRQSPSRASARTGR